MAILEPGYSLVLDIMRLFQRIGTRGAWTAEEIWVRINEETPGFRWYEEPYLLRWRVSQDIRDPVELIEAALRSLAELGVISGEGERETSSGFERWRIAPSWQPPELPSGRGGGGDGDVPGERNEGDGEDGEGGGIREVLSHPVLFALEKDDFEQLVAGLFEGGRA